MRISDWSSDVCSSDLVAQPGCHREEQSEERQQRGTAAGKIAVQRPQETLRHRLALGYESCDLSRHYVPPDLLIWGSLGATLRRIRYRGGRSEEHTSELQSLMRISYAVFCLKKKKRLRHKTIELLTS